MKPCYVFDIDGTIADCSHRLHFIEKAPKDWTSFFAACPGDKPIEHVTRLLRDLSQTNYPVDIVFVSGRSDECRQATLDWLDANAFTGPLYMRKAGDYRADDIIKIELLAELRADGYEPIMVFDDRTRVVKAFRAAGVPVAQVAEGDF